jgi:hypothetical protein
MTVPDEMLYDRLWKLASVTAPPIDESDLDQEATHRLLAMARVHGVLGLVLHKLRACPPAHLGTWDIAQRAWRGEVVQSMRVRRHAEEVLRTLGYAGIPATIIKGPDFADHLFPEPRLRPTLDVDVLVPRNRWRDAICMLEATGHQEKAGQPGPFLPTGVLSERTWVYPLAGAEIEVDLHWSLVHFPFFRRQASVEYWNLDWRWQPDGKGELTAASRLIIAIVHALYHHQFERLLQLVDIQQACRQIQSEADRQAVRALMERTGATVALDLSLQVTARFLADRQVEDLRQILLEGPFVPLVVPDGLLADARKNLRTIRTHYIMPSRRRIREWLMRQPVRPLPGWEFRPANGP